MNALCHKPLSSIATTNVIDRNAALTNYIAMINPIAVRSIHHYGICIAGNCGKFSI